MSKSKKPSPPKPAAKSKPPRKCCGTPSGQDNPHAADCPMTNPPEKKKERGPLKNPRLPNGSRFEARYTATSETEGYWDGTLHIIREGKADAVFNATAGGVFPMMTKLDAFYRKYVASRAEKPA